MNTPTIKELGRQIEVRNESQWHQLRSTYGTVDDIAREIGVSRATAYRYCSALPKVYIWYKGHRWTCYEIRLARGVWAMQRRGNPRFRDSDWQSMNRRKHTPWQ